jgi:hypothetical protein
MQWRTVFFFKSWFSDYPGTSNEKTNIQSSQLMSDHAHNVVSSYNMCTYNQIYPDL